MANVKGKPLSTAVHRRFSFQTQCNALGKPRMLRAVRVSLVAVTDVLRYSQNLISTEVTGSVADLIREIQPRVSTRYYSLLWIMSTMALATQVVKLTSV